MIGYCTLNYVKEGSNTRPKPLGNTLNQLNYKTLYHVKIVLESITTITCLLNISDYIVSEKKDMKFRANINHRRYKTYPRPQYCLWF